MTSPEAVRARLMSETRSGAMDTGGALDVHAVPDQVAAGDGPAFRDLARDQLPRLYSIASSPTENSTSTSSRTPPEPTSKLVALCSC